MVPKEGNIEATSTRILEKFLNAEKRGGADGKYEGVELQRVEHGSTPSSAESSVDTVHWTWSLRKSARTVNTTKWLFQNSLKTLLNNVYELQSSVLNM